MEAIIKSISYDQTEIIKNILKLYVPDQKIDCDATYSVGNFYKDTGIEEPRLKFDIHPSCPDVTVGDSRNLPIESCSIKCIMFDPPFLATSGASLRKSDDSNRINKRFGVYPNEKELHQFYIGSIKEAYRVLENDGIYIVKCQDKVSSGKQYLSHVFFVNEATKAGFYPIDLFVLLAKTRLVAKWQRNQKHARKYHCYFLVFKKTRRRVEYV
jgi:hypothetical protein